VERSPFTIGRGSANDAVIRVDSSVSSSHASLLFENGGWFIQDLASSNGTFVNRRKLAKNEKAPLPPGASVGLGKTVTLRFEQIGKSSEPAPVRDPRASMIEAQITAQLGALKMVSPADNPIELPITGLECSVGRATDNAITIPADGKSGVSSHHALVYSLSGRWFIRDVGSANGTFVNGKPVPSGGTLELVQGSIIGLGPKVKLEFIKND
jgi:pSer/pThr/pTyr-binding forkhead associated (FHA) protein